MELVIKDVDPIIISYLDIINDYRSVSYVNKYYNKLIGINALYQDLYKIIKFLSINNNENDIILILLRACKKNYLQLVKYIIHRYKIKLTNFGNILSHVMKKGYLDMVKYLVDTFGVPKYFISSKLEMIFYNLCYNGDIKMLDYCISISVSDTEYLEDPILQCGFEKAFSKNHIEVVTFLKKYCKTIDCALNYDSLVEIMLYDSININLSGIKFIIDTYREENIAIDINKCFLNFCKSNNCIDVVKYLVENYDYTLNIQTGLNKGLKYGQFPIVKYLVEHSILSKKNLILNMENIYVTDDDSTFQILQYLIEHGEKINTTIDIHNNNDIIMIKCCCRKNLKTVEFLLRYAISINEPYNIFNILKNLNISIVPKLLQIFIEYNISINESLDIYYNDNILIKNAWKVQDLEMVDFLIRYSFSMHEPYNISIINSLISDVTKYHIYHDKFIEIATTLNKFYKIKFDLNYVIQLYIKKNKFKDLKHLINSYSLIGPIFNEFNGLCDSTLLDFISDSGNENIIILNHC